jgi:hypothetical protein
MIGWLLVVKNEKKKKKKVVRWIEGRMEGRKEKETRN